MAQIVADRQDIDFVLHDQLGVEALSEHERFQDFTKKTIDLVVSEARNLALKEILPGMKEADEEGCTFDSGNVSVPKSYHRTWDIYKEGEWIAMTDDPKWGGQGMPSPVALAATNYFHGANNSFTLQAGLNHGAGKLVETFGTDKQKELYLKKMYSGVWGGSMLLTEAGAGSDLGELTTRAVKNDDGTYSLTGNKIFISSGDTDLVPNIIHPVLARIDGAPKGPGGISLFLVPKIWVNDDGSLGEDNDIVCTGIEEKMGIHGSPTCSMAIGGKNDCKATLLGQENKGLMAMFVMMNEARLLCGMQAFSCASASYLNALNYARKRVQGKSLMATGKDSKAVPILQHPDIRRMLMTMKSNTEAQRSFLFYIGFLEDRIKVCESDEERVRLHGLIDLLTPVAKAYVSDRSFEVCSLGMQVFGGYGYTKEYPQEQLLRDCKITHIYEGTNGIQAMDLLGRKLGLKKGAAFNDLLNEIKATIANAKEIKGLETLAASLEQNVAKLSEVALSLAQKAGSPDVLNAFANAYPFMEVTGDTIMAWMLLWRALEAARNLEGKVKKKDRLFYEGQLKSAQFYINSALPISLGKMSAILLNDSAVMEISEGSFSV